MNKNQKETLRQVAEELNQAFNDWDSRIKIGLPAVPIQDLDYWSKKIFEVLGEGE